MDSIIEDYKNLISFWDKVFKITNEEMHKEEAEAWKDLAPSTKLFDAAASLGSCKKVLDYGCGSAWAGIIAAKSGCPEVLCVDVTENGIETATFNAQRYDVASQLKTQYISSTWLSQEPEEKYDGFFCSNVLDVIPTEMAQEIIRESARVVTENAKVIFSFNYYQAPDAPLREGFERKKGNQIYINGVLRLVSKSDEEWAALFEPYYTIEKLDHFAWPGEETERRRLFFLRRKPVCD